VRAPSVSVVICAYTEERLGELLRAVDSVAGQTRPPLETIVVVDHNEALRCRIEDLLPAVKVIGSSSPPGLSGARNAGVAAAAGDVVAFIDDDAVAEPTWLEHLSVQYARDEVVGVGGLIVPAWASARPAWFPEEFNWVVGCSYRGLPSSRRSVRNLIGANMSFRREAVERAGGFASGVGRVGDRSTGLRLLAAARSPKECEETEFCLRLHARAPGRVLLYEPAAVVRHLVPRERSTWRYFLRRCYGEGTSKALIARLAGRGRGLSSERAYAARALPSGLAREIRGAVRDRRLAPLGRAAAIAAGFATVATGFVAGLAFGGSADRPRV